MFRTIIYHTAYRRSHETNPKKCMVRAGTCNSPAHFPVDGIQDELKTVPRKKCLKAE